MKIDRNSKNKHFPILIGNPINVGQKDKENQWRVVDLAEFLYTALLYQAMTNRNINAATLLEQYSVLVEKEQWATFLHRGWLFMSA